MLWSNFVSHHTGSLHCSQTLSQESRVAWKAEYIGMCFHILVRETLSGYTNSHLWYEVDQSNDLQQSQESNDLQASVGLALSWVKWEMQFEIPSGKGVEKYSKQESNHLATRNKKPHNSRKKN